MAKTGKILMKEGLISPSDVARGLAVQEKNRTALTRNRGQLFGMVLCDMNLVTPLDTYHALEKHDKLVSVADFLVKKNIVTRSAMKRIKDEARKKGLPLITYLVDARIVPKPLLRQILFDLFHVPFRSVSDIVFNHQARKILSGIIPEADAKAHGVIPLQLMDHTLVIGITAPENLVFLKDLDRSYPQYRISPVFISFSGFSWFYKLLYQSDGTGRTQADREKGQKTETGKQNNSALIVTDPDRDRSDILTFYHRYENTRQPQGTDHPDRSRRFLEFIYFHHEKICREYGCHRVKFSLDTGNDGRVTLQARPVKEAKEAAWQK
ncbi:MAG: hypothetical protein MI802_00410 [Desulfobacterales bacterium]|nr:hypothetical protein [Desulfobacterales bacterium]